MPAWGGKIHFESLTKEQRNYVINGNSFCGENIYTQK